MALASALACLITCRFIEAPTAQIPRRICRANSFRRHWLCLMLFISVIGRLFRQ